MDMEGAVSVSTSNYSYNLIGTSIIIAVVILVAIVCYYKRDNIKAIVTKLLKK